MLRVVIKAPANKSWVDHAGNRIYELEFSMNNEAQYVAGHYAIESFGKLDRNIEDFRKSPLQSLSDWDISLPSVFSSKDYQTQTIDLLYWIEAKNEAAGIDFDLTGSEAILYDGDTVLYRYMVSSTATSNLRTDIRLSERMGSPEINASFFPTVAGGAEVDKWQVKIERDFQMFSITISDRYLSSKPEFYIYMEKSDEYIPVDFNVTDKEWWPNFNYVRMFPSLSKITTISPLQKNELVKLRFGYQYNSAEYIGLLSKVRPGFRDEPSASPDTILIGGQFLYNAFFEYEFAEAWSSYAWRESGSDYYYTPGRTKNKYLDAYYNTPIPVSVFDGQLNIKFSIDYPIDSMVTGPNISQSLNDIQTRGNLLTMRDLSKEYSDRPLSEEEWEQVPTIRFIYKGKIILHLKFSLDLPSGAIIHRLELYSRIKTDISFQLDLKINGVSNGFTILKPQNGSQWKHYFTEYPDISNLDDLTLEIETSSNEGMVQIAGIRLGLDLEQPLEKVQALYASGTFYDTQPPDAGDGNANSGNSIVQSVKMLLSAAKLDYRVEAPKEESLNEARYGTIIRNESVSLRDKLRSLAAESGTMIKFSPTEDVVILKSVSRMQQHTPIRIGLSAFVLANNMYSFKMESPDRNDIASSVVISWGKDMITGKYDHILEVNSQGLYRDNSFINPDGKWGSIIEQLKKGLGNARNLNAEWIMDWEGAEIMAYDYLCWNCVPLRKAQAECIKSLIPAGVDIGEFVCFDLPGYPRKFYDTSWVVTGMHDDLDRHLTTIELLEAWNMPAVPENRYLLMENGNNILLEDSNKIKLEKISDG